MKNYDVALRPIHCASVSGGKDSLYMLGLILANPDKYPLDMVVHFELDIDFPWVKNVVDYMEKRCTNNNIKFVRIKPDFEWIDNYNKVGYPTRVSRWCSNQYKKSCHDQLDKWIKSQNCRPVMYIGFCADEVKRFKYQLKDYKEGFDEVYPLALEGIEEHTILDWAKNIDIFENWYKIFERQGCMMCPLSTMKERAYIKIKYPELYKYYMDLAYKSENERHYTVFQGNAKYNCEYQDKRIVEYWLPKVKEEMKEKGII